MTPGEVIVPDEQIELNHNRDKLELQVANHGDRPIQIGSHYHFFEVNDALVFDREKAFGYRLDIASGTAVRFEPGQIREVALVKIGGRRHIYGFQGKVMGPLDDASSSSSAIQE